MLPDWRLDLVGLAIVRAVEHDGQRWPWQHGLAVTHGLAVPLGASFRATGRCGSKLRPPCPERNNIMKRNVASLTATTAFLTLWTLMMGLPSGRADAQGQSCAASAGRATAQDYARHCIEVSPATHPPCHVDNPCDMIIGEIRRGCAMLGRDAPALCRLPAYR